MKRLTLLRHGKSDWGAGESDFGRPLNTRGRRDVPRMGEVCSEKLPRPDLILLSHAARTRETVDLMIRAWGLGGIDVREAEQLYLGGLNDWIAVLGEYESAAEHILACGHMPGLEYAARWLDPEFSGKVSTSAVISLTLSRDLGPGAGQTDFYGRPGLFR